MVRSADRRWVLLGAAPLVVGLLAGCDTTQQQSARARLVATRELSAGRVVRVTRSNPAIAVARVAVVRGGTDSAIVVRLRNLGPRPVNDLPINVGIATAHGRAYLNRGSDLPYFQTHAPAIAAGGEAAWVLTTSTPVRRGAPFAAVGFATSPAPAAARSLPRLEVSAGRAAARQGSAVLARVRNPSSVPQYGLEVYAFALRARRYVAAGHASLTRLGTGKSATVAVRLVGRAPGVAVTLQAPPTIFQ